MISPYVPRATVDPTVRDHASVPSTLRAIFAPGADALTRRDAWARPFHELLSLAEPRRDDLPDLSAFVSAIPVPAEPVAAAAVDAVSRAGVGRSALVDSYAPYAAQARTVHRRLVRLGEDEVRSPLLSTTAQDRADEIARRFAAAAARHRAELGDAGVR